MDLSGTRDALADHLDSQSSWRMMKAEEHPEDDRNRRWAAELDRLAMFVRGLPDNDASLIRLDSTWSFYGPDVFSTVGPMSERMTSRPDLPADGGHRRWFDDFVETYVGETVDQLIDADDYGQLFEFAEDRDPKIALAAVRTLRTRLDDCEELAVVRAVAESWSWSRIGAALGVSKQAAWEKHHDAGDLIE
jgi:hypothetical protein